MKNDDRDQDFDPTFEFTAKLSWHDVASALEDIAPTTEDPPQIPYRVFDAIMALLQRIGPQVLKNTLDETSLADYPIGVETIAAIVSASAHHIEIFNAAVDGYLGFLEETSDGGTWKEERNNLQLSVTKINEAVKRIGEAVERSEEIRQRRRSELRSV